SPSLRDLTFALDGLCLARSPPNETWRVRRSSVFPDFVVRMIRHVYDVDRLASFLADEPASSRTAPAVPVGLRLLRESFPPERPARFTPNATDRLGPGLPALRPPHPRAERPEFGRAPSASAP